MAEHSINGAAWLDALRKLYQASPNRAGGEAVLMIVQQQVKSMVGLRGELGEPVLGGGQHSVAKALTSWDVDFGRLLARMDEYDTDVDPCRDLPGGSCEGWDVTGWEGTSEEQANRYSQIWAADPLLFGRFPEDYYIGLSKPGRADVLEVVTLWNQLVALEPLREQLDDTSTLIGEWLVAAEAQLSLSAPGEDSTIADWFAEAAANAANFAGKVGGAFITGALVVGGVLVSAVGLWWWSKNR